MAVPDDLPTFAATPSFLKRDVKVDRGSRGAGTADEPDEGAAWKGGKSLVGAHSAPKVSYYFPKGVGEYHFGERHPMKPHRLTLTNHLVAGYGLFDHLDVYQPRDATKEELETFHAPDYIDFLERVTPDNVRTFASTLQRFNIGDDCPIFDGLFPFCKQYAGASMMAARKLNSGAADITVNWSGGLHHAKKFEASGFCYVNDIVMAILELLRIHPRVLYIDIDIHHGDGVQEAFYQSNRVLTVSFHKYSADFFPGTGHIDECGHGLGKNFSLNVPLQDGIDNESYVTLFKAVMEPTISIFRPSAIVLQCGADSLGCDRLGCFNLSISAHGECVRYIKAFNIPLMVVGGGGYTMKNVARCWTYETSVLLADSCPPISNTLPSTPYDSQFSPDYRLHPNLTARVENLNTRKSLDRIRIGILERLRYMHGAPSVQMQQLPPSLAQWLTEEEEETEKGKKTARRDDDDEPKRPGSPDDYFSARKSITGGSRRVGSVLSTATSATTTSSRPATATTAASLSARSNMPPPAMPGRARMLGSTSSTVAASVTRPAAGCDEMDTS